MMTWSRAHWLKYLSDEVILIVLVGLTAVTLAPDLFGNVDFGIMTRTREHHWLVERLQMMWSTRLLFNRKLWTVAPDVC